MPEKPSPVLIHIYNQSSFSGREKMMDSFLSLYLKGFPDPNEREEMDIILDRVTSPVTHDGPNTFIILAAEASATEVVYGGIICDWYFNSRAIHLTYVVRDEAIRGSGVGRMLIFDGIGEMKQLIADTYGITLTNVFFESNNPGMTDARADSIDPLLRLRIFAGMGARWIDIPYIQPPLDTEKESVGNLYLFTFPALNEDHDAVRAHDIKTFLSDLYLGLGIVDPMNDRCFVNMCEALDKNLNGFFPLKSVPIERPLFMFESASVVLHFLETGVEKGMIAGNDPAKVYCRYFNSYEKDLLNYQNQKSLKFFTCIEDGWMNKKITLMPGRVYNYISEGRKERRHTGRSKIDARCSVSSTYYTDAGIRIWHLVVTPSEGSCFSEFDLIKLISSFGSRQEATDINDNLTIEYQGSQYGDFADLLCGVVQMAERKNIMSCETGIVQLDTRGASLFKPEPFNWEMIFSLVANIKDKGYFQAEDQDMSEDSLLMYSMKMLCGILLGIFDFERMSPEEITDTIFPVQDTDSYYTFMSRGNILCLGKEEEMLSAVYSTIGINPYLLIPSSVLAYNRHILEATDSDLDTALALNSQQPEKLRHLQQTRSGAENTVNTLLLTGIFQYPSETVLLNEGIRQRGIDTMLEKIRLKVVALTNKIDDIIKKNASKAQGQITVIISLFPVLAMYPVLEPVFKSFMSELYMQSPFMEKYFCGIVIIVLSIGTAIVVYRKSLNKD